MRQGRVQVMTVRASFVRYLARGFDEGILKEREPRGLALHPDREEEFSWTIFTLTVRMSRIGAEIFLPKPSPIP